MSNHFKKTAAMERVAVYIDGFNLYYGLKSKRQGRRGKRWPCYYWLDMHRMSQKILQREQALTIVRYFTARVHHDVNDPDKVHRQNTYIEALATLPRLRIHEGYFVQKIKKCRRCGSKYKDYEEKMTDVNIAMELLSDAHHDVFDTAIIISADGDLAGPVAKIRRTYPGKKVVMAFPPDRNSARLQKLANGFIRLRQDTLRTSQLPRSVTGYDGHVLQCPAEWK